MRYHIATFGCQANEADSERIAGLLEKIGYTQTSEQKNADVLVFNSCSVRQTAEDRVFGLNKKLKELKNKSHKLKTILTGCMTHYPMSALKKRLPHIDIFLPIKDLEKLPELLNKKEQDTNLMFLPKYQSSFRAYIPISQGCDNLCSYCIVPYARGKEISRPAEEIICEARRLAKAGFKELWLLGQNVNNYCFKLKSQNSKIKITNQNSKIIKFPELLKIVNDIPGNFWLRFTSPHPKDFSCELIQTMAESEKFCHYLNLPVQSGDNEILKKMSRPYTIEKYKELVARIRKAMPDIALSTDIIVGFPGETKKQFENTAKLFEEIKFDMAYISQYSPRPGTKAAELRDDVPKQEKKQREKILTEILKKTGWENNQKYVGRTEEILIEKFKKDYLLGKNKANKTIKIPSDSTKNPEEIIGNFRKIEIKKALAWGLEGGLVA